MYISRTILAGLLSLPVVSAFLDTSPFFLFSTVSFPKSVTSKSQSISSTEVFRKIAVDVIEACTSDAYIIISQPGLHANDFRHHDSAPELRRRISKRGQQVFQIDHGKGSVDVASLKEIAIKSCGAHEVTVDARTGTFSVIENNMRPSLIPLDFPKLPSDGKSRAKVLREHDVLLSALLSSLPTDKFTVIYTSTPVDDVDAIRSSVHEDGRPDTIPSTPILKRDVVMASANATTPGLFQRYQFFTTGVFLALVTILILVSIFMVGLNAITSIQVSYGAFEKEMGPAEQKKKN